VWRSDFKTSKWYRRSRLGASSWFDGVALPEFNLMLPRQLGESQDWRRAPLGLALEAGEAR